MTTSENINAGVRVGSLARTLSEPTTVLLLIAIVVAVLALLPEASQATTGEAVGAVVVPVSDEGA